MPRLSAAAFVDDAKISRYLLNLDHKDDGPKAAVLIGYGFSPDRPDELKQALLEIGRSGEAALVHGRSGIKYIVDGSCRTPDGRTLHLRTVWFASVADEPAEVRYRLPEEAMIIEEHSGAVLVRDLPELGLRAGDYGVVVHVARDPGDIRKVRGYLLEVFAADGSTIDVFDVPADAVRPGRADDVPCVRPIAAE